MTTPLQTTHLHETETGETELTIEFTFTPGYPGRLTGPPEHCYPPEPAEIEICSIKDPSGAEVTESLSAETYDECEAAAWEEVEKISEPDYWA